MMQLPPLERLQYPVNYYEGGRRECLLLTNIPSVVEPSSIILVVESFFSHVYTDNICLSFIRGIIDIQIKLVILNITCGYYQYELRR